ncbi:hypothetical protein [Sphingomonas crusticola]|uniref:hypothetical protein n=1 Tax=Sphingomonas crusticola TaxID=1697973 RepID=UPI000E24AE7C|nr:hypothetical protein [Sphingomonas crusticola]
MLDTNIAESQAPGALELDPFAFHPGAVSRIAGLGGTGPAPTPEYVFHTPYVEAAAGKAIFHVQFHGLTAKSGTLVLRVHMLPMEPGGRSRMVNSQRVALNRLAHLGGEIAISFEGYHDVVFGLLAIISGDTDAAATGVTVTLDRPADPTQRPAQGAEARGTAYGKTPLTPAPSLLSTDVPTLANPVSQIATTGQLRESIAGGWMSRLRPQGKAGVEHWRKVYTLQVLRRYGMLEHGAVGLGFEPSPSGVPAALAAMQTRVVAAFPARPGYPLNPDTLKQDLRGRAPCDERAFEENIIARIASWRNIPEDLVNFDFLWSSHANERLYSVAAAAQFVENAMRCLRPGGLAVHTMSYDLAPGGRSTPSSERVLLQQNDVERLGLVLVSRGHEVAQFKFSTADAILADGAKHGVARRTMVGLIARKARLPD